jgi:hypothetical protein
LSLLLQLKCFRKRFNFIAAWVIDSFWVDRIPRFAKSSSYFDHIFITIEEGIERWSRIQTLQLHGYHVLLMCFTEVVKTPHGNGL